MLKQEISCSSLSVWEWQGQMETDLQKRLAATSWYVDEGLLYVKTPEGWRQAMEGDLVLVEASSGLAWIVPKRFC